MLLRAKMLKNSGLDSLDGEIGKVKEFYFDDLHWTIRYLVVDTGGWISGRRVLISPHALVSPIGEGQNIAVNLTKMQIESSPSINADKPVSRQQEDELHAYYGWPPYWTMGPFAGVGYPVPMFLPETAEDNSMADKPQGDPHLRSTEDVTGYHIHAIDGQIGHAEDFVVDDETWAIRYVVVDTKNWWPGKHVLVSPHWIERVSWSDSKIFANLSREAIERAPEFSESLTRDYEAELFRHYDREGYWEEEHASHR